MSSANAAAVVIGRGLAHSCYVSAQFGDNAREGIDICTHALEHEPLTKTDRASTFVNRGVLRASGGHEYDALADYDHAIAVDATLAQAYVDRSAALIALKRYDEALKSASDGLNLGPAQPELAYFNRAIAEEALNNVNGAYQDFKQAVALSPQFTAASDQLKRFRVVTSPGSGT
jgi:tetratricopeptide (TPR) repeat protein